MIIRWRTIGITLVLLSGVVAVATGLWFIGWGHPYNGPGGYAEEFDATRDEVAATNPALAEWVRHVALQVASVSIGWGLFVSVIAATGLRTGEPWARRALWIGGLPTLLFSSLHEWIFFGEIDPGTVTSMLAAVLFAAGLGLTYLPSSDDARAGRGTKAPT